MSPTQENARCHDVGFILGVVAEELSYLRARADWQTRTSNLDADDVVGAAVLRIAKQAERVGIDNRLNDWSRSVRALMRWTVRAVVIDEVRRSTPAQLRDEAVVPDPHGSQPLETTAALRRAVATLPMPLNNIVRQTYWEGRTSAELAVEHNRSPSWVRMELQRARHMLRDHFTDTEAASAVH